MTDTTEAADPQAEETIEEKTGLPTLDDIREAKQAKLDALAEGDAPKPEEEVEEEEEAEEVESEDETETEEEEEEDSSPSVLSQEQFDSMSEEDKESLLEKLRPSTGKAFGEMRKQLRELTQRAEAAEAAQKEVATVSDSPYARLTSESQVDESISAVEENITKYEDELIYNQTTKYDDATDKEIRGIEVNGQFVDVASVRKWAKEQKESISKLRERKDEIRKVSKMFDNEDIEIETLKQTHNMSDEESKAFEASLSDPSFAVIKSVRPEYAKALYEVFAKASISDRKPKTRKAPKARNENTSVPKGANTNSKSIVSQIQKLENIVSGKTKGVDLTSRKNAARELRLLRKKV